MSSARSRPPARRFGPTTPPRPDGSRPETRARHRRRARPGALRERWMAGRRVSPRRALQLRAGRRGGDGAVNSRVRAPCSRRRAAQAPPRRPHLRVPPVGPFAVARRPRATSARGELRVPYKRPSLRQSGSRCRRRRGHDVVVVNPTSRSARRRSPDASGKMVADVAGGRARGISRAARSTSSRSTTSRAGTSMHMSMVVAGSAIYSAART